MHRLKYFLFALLLSIVARPALANSIPYAQIGTVAPTVTTYAAGSGGVNVFYDGGTTSYTDYIGVYDLQTGYNSGLILDNKTTTLGTEVTVGSSAGQINAGDQLVFYLASPEGISTSVPAGSADGINHAYITTYSGGTINGVAVPAGLFVGMEDENASHSDLTYNDDDFIVTNVRSPAVTPEPASILLLGTGLLASLGVLRRRLRSEE